MVRGDHQNKPPGGPFDLAKTYIHVVSFAGNLTLLLEGLSEWTSGGHCNAWFAAAIRTTTSGSLQRMVRGGRQTSRGVVIEGEPR